MEGQFTFVIDSRTPPYVQIVAQGNTVSVVVNIHTPDEANVANVNEIVHAYNLGHVFTGNVEVSISYVVPRVRPINVDISPNYGRTFNLKGKGKPAVKPASSNSNWRDHVAPKANVKPVAPQQKSKQIQNTKYSESKVSKYQCPSQRNRDKYKPKKPNKAERKAAKKAAKLERKNQAIAEIRNGNYIERFAEHLASGPTAMPNFNRKKKIRNYIRTNLNLPRELPMVALDRILEQAVKKSGYVQTKKSTGWSDDENNDEDCDENNDENNDEECESSSSSSESETSKKSVENKSE